MPKVTIAEKGSSAFARPRADKEGSRAKKKRISNSEYRIKNVEGSRDQGFRGSRDRKKENTEYRTLNIE